MIISNLFKTTKLGDAVTKISHLKRQVLYKTTNTYYKFRSAALGFILKVLSSKPGKLYTSIIGMVIHQGSSCSLRRDGYGQWKFY